MDGANVPYVRPAPPQRAAHGRLRLADGHPQALQETQTTQARPDGKTRQMLGAVSQRGQLVLVEEHGCQDHVTERRGAGYLQLPIGKCQNSMPSAFKSENWQSNIDTPPLVTWCPLWLSSCLYG